MFISGQVDYDDKGQPGHPGDFAAQARATYSALKAQVEAGGEPGGLVWPNDDAMRGRILAQRDALDLTCRLVDATGNTGFLSREPNLALRADRDVVGIVALGEVVISVGVTAPA